MWVVPEHRRESWISRAQNLASKIWGTKEHIQWEVPLYYILYYLYGLGADKTKSAFRPLPELLQLDSHQERDCCIHWRILHSLYHYSLNRAKLTASWLFWTDIFWSHSDIPTRLNLNTDQHLFSPQCPNWNTIQKTGEFKNWSNSHKNFPLKTHCTSESVCRLYAKEWAD